MEGIPSSAGLGLKRPLLSLQPLRESPQNWQITHSAYTGDAGLFQGQGRLAEILSFRSGVPTPIFRRCSKLNPNTGELMAKQTGAKKTASKVAEPAPVPPPPQAEAAPAASYRLGDAEALGRNMARVAAQSQYLLSEFLKRQSGRFGQEPFDPLNVSGAFFALLN